ncbi:MAG: hypothetical protein JWQ10_3684 [Herbaspirillum sp.]|nr:hypothetical protein [Herbaspirillum sp.]
MGQCMSLSAGAANSSIPIFIEPPINAARSSATTTQNSSVQIVTRRYRYDHNSSLPCLDSVNDWSRPGGTPAALEKRQRVKIRDESELINAWNRVMEDGNPEGKTLQDLTLILTQLMVDASRNKCNELSLASDHGRITLKVKSDGRANTYVPDPNNGPKEKKEKSALINDELTLSALRALYDESAVNDFLSGRYPVGAVSSAPRINEVKSSATATTPPTNTARSSATEKKNPNVQIVTKSYMDDHNLLDGVDLQPVGTVKSISREQFYEAKVSAVDELGLQWERVMQKANREAKDLGSLTRILRESLLCAKREGLKTLPLLTERGGAILEVQPGSRVNTYVPISDVPVSDNCPEYKQEMNVEITDELTLSIFRGIYGARILNYFLSGKRIDFDNPEFVQ